MSTPTLGAQLEALATEFASLWGVPGDGATPVFVTLGEDDAASFVVDLRAPMSDGTLDVEATS